MSRAIVFAAALVGVLLISLAPAASAQASHGRSRPGCSNAAHATVKRTILATHRTQTSVTRTVQVRLVSPICGRVALAEGRAGVKSPQDEAKCDETVQIIKSKSYPGYMQSVAYSDNCVGTPLPSDCSQAADMQFFDKGEHPDGDGPTTYGCRQSDASIRTKSCSSSTTSYGYRTYGIFTITWEGVVYGPYGVPSTEITAARIC